MRIFTIFAARGTKVMSETTEIVYKVRKPRRKGISFNLELRPRANTFPIYLRITEEGKHYRFKSTILLSKKSDWDSQRQKIRYTEPNRDKWQEELDKLVERAMDIYRELEKEGTASPDKIIEELTHGNRKGSSFLEYAERLREECRKNGQLSSMNKYNQVCRKFTSYMNSRGRNPYSVTFKEMDYEFISDFVSYLSSLDNKQYMPHGEKPDICTPGAPKLHPNYIRKILQYVNTVFKSAEKAKIIKHEDNPFLTYTKLKPVKTDREELTQDEVQRVINLELKPGTKEWHSRNFFLFAMYCAGIRIGDVLCLRWINITDDNRLHYQMSKNHKIQDIPLLPPALEILSLYRDEATSPEDYIFPYMKGGRDSELWAEIKTVKDFDILDGDMKLKYKRAIMSKESLVNNGLKIIHDKLGLTKPLTTHIARHTFARLAKEVHLDNSLVQGLLKHSSLSTTEKYMGRFSTDAQDEALKAVFQPMAPEMMRKKDILNRLAELSLEELEALLAIHKEKQASK